MNELVLYTHPYSRGRIAHWMLEEVGQPHRIEWAEFGPAMKTPEFLALNPMGKVPVLTHGDVVVTEAAAICAYLADRFPDSGLAPVAHDSARGPWYRWLFFAAGPVEQAVTAHSMGWQVPEGKDAFVGFGSYARVLDTLEKAVSAAPYLCGEFSAADVYVGSHLGWGMMFGSIEKRPAFEEYVARLQARPAAQRADRINAERIEAMQKKA
ncbi:glutathione S-transferase family protein [Azoarcus olearius]|uniref:Glutathione transferase n=1 Tax=Azoarcus sp. (strain BH72) TaxID=418699 RepID=A1K7S9_AZOSB|nr:glutathione S-transferase family protein [Azoarcus olearius]CAL94884.1 putative glutathione transferase [Azoarcus olearius]